MKEIYLVDYIGDHCGMQYFHDSMCKYFGQRDMDIDIVSNYTRKPDGEPVLLNHYKGSKISKITRLLRNLRRLKRHVAKHPEGVYVYESFGNIIDIAFIKILSKSKNLVVDIHEAIAQDVDSNQRLKNQFRDIFANKVRTVISHSKRTDNFLDEFGFKGKKFKVPHFKYMFPKEFDVDRIPQEILDAPKKDKVNLLFFGNLNENKGVDVLMEAMNLLPDDVAAKCNLVIAGKDFDGAVDRVAIKPGRNVEIFRRHISDDELRYLYSKADYLCLPYRKTSQSGILEMAFYFKKPIIASDVPYFRTTLEEFPSFGKLSGTDARAYAKTLTEVIENHSANKFYNDTDYAKYENRQEVADFLDDFQGWYTKM